MQSADPPVALPFLRLVSELTQIPYNTLLYQWHGVENHLGHDLIPKSAAGGTLGAAQGAVGGTRVVSYSKAELVSQQNVELLWNCVLASMKSRNPEMTMPDLKLVSRKTGFPYNTLLYQWHGIENHLGQEMVGKH
ncbi:hypothetical protein N7470_008642 [Penicillium chermesinum]|nr:hypothetical protein N7470_008642 [Penicillium chermesinum]